HFSYPRESVAAVPGSAHSPETTEKALPHLVIGRIWPLQEDRLVVITGLPLVLHNILGRPKASILRVNRIVIPHLLIHLARAGAAVRPQPIVIGGWEFVVDSCQRLFTLSAAAVVNLGAVVEVTGNATEETRMVRLCSDIDPDRVGLRSPGKNQ